jgi:TRAP-type uncharacterized transport system fused permease subunit
VLPLAVMIYLLMSGVTPSYAASWAIAALVVVSWLTSVLAKVVGSDAFEPVQMGPSKISEALLIGIKSSVMTGILLVTIGIMNNAIVTSGIGNGFSLMIAQWSGGSLVIAILLIGLASLVLGMGLPVTAAYIILAILTAPALAGILADSIIIDQLVAGIADPAKSAFFMLVDSPHAAKVATGMLREEAVALMAAMPFEIAITVRPLLVDPVIPGLLSADGASDHLLAEPGQQCDAAGLSCCLYRRRDRGLASRWRRVSKAGRSPRASTSCR